MSQGQFQSKTIPLAKSELSKRVREFIKSCSSEDSKQVSKANTQSQELYHLLLEPVVASFPNGESIAIETDEPMAALPFEALKSSNGTYFGEKYSFIYSPGLFVETALRVPSALQPSDRLLAIDGSMVNDSLPGHDTASEAVKKVKTQIKLVPAPLAVEAFRSELQKAAAFSFFGHAVSKGTGAALKLGPDSFMTARELDPKLLAHMKIAVLAACSSGSAEKGLLDSGSLVRAFLAGGVPTVLSSRWNVESKSTAQFVEKFYSHLALEPAPLAMRNARREMRAQNPYYWAGFSLTGRIN